MSNPIFCVKNGFLTLIAEESVCPLRRCRSSCDLGRGMRIEIEEKIDYSPASIASTISGLSDAETTATLSQCDQSTRSSEKAQAPWRKLNEFVTENQVDSDNYTTIMLRNIPAKYTMQCLIEEIRQTGNECNFVHLPLSKKMDMNLGYAFVNFLTPAMAQDFLEAFNDYQFQKYPNGAKRAAVDYASMQGFEANVEFYSKRRIAGTVRAPWVLEQ